MATWNRAVITNKGIELMNNSLKNQNIRITDIKLSSKVYSGDLRDLTSLTDIKKSIPISSINKINENVIQIRAIISNSGNREKYKLETMGLFVGNDLFAVVTATDSDTMPIDNGTGVLNIDFEWLLNINRNANFSINYNTDALLTNRDLNTIVEGQLGTKANFSDVITNLRTQGNILKYTKNNQEFSLTLAQEVPDSTDTVAGKISKNSIRAIVDEKVTDTRIKQQALAKMQEFGLGANRIADFNGKTIDSIMDIGMYVIPRGLNGKTTCLLNFQYDSSWGLQLGLTEEEKPKAFLRQKAGGWKPWTEIHTTNNLEPATVDEIWAGVSNG